MNKWPVKRLGEVANIVTGKIDVNKADTDGAFPFYTCGEKVLKINTSAFDGKSILIAGNGDFGVKYHSGGKFNAYQRTYVIKDILEKTINSRYLYFILSTKIAKFKMISQGGIIKYLRLPQLQDLDIPIPKSTIQKKIVKRLDAIREVQELCDTQIFKTEELFSSTLNVELKNINQTKIGRLEEFCDLITDGIHNTPTLVPAGGIPMLDSKDIDDLIIKSDNPSKFISEETDRILAQRCKPQKRDILISSRGTIGKIAMVGDQNFNIMGNIILIRTNKSKLTERFLMFYILVNRDEFLKLATGSSQKGLYLGRIRVFPVKIPNIKLQQQIIEKLDAIQNYKVLLLKQKSLLRELFGSVLYKSMNGEMDN